MVTGRDVGASARIPAYGVDGVVGCADEESGDVADVGSHVVGGGGEVSECCGVGGSVGVYHSTSIAVPLVLLVLFECSNHAI